MTNAFRVPDRVRVASAIVIQARVVAAVCAAIVYTNGPIVRAQATTGAVTANPPRFDVATVKRNVSRSSEIGTVFQPDGRYRAANVRLRDLVAEAYQVRDSQVAGGPLWVASERFDIEARSEDAAAFELVPKADGTRAIPEKPFLMLRELLNDRFKLVVHRETRESAVYALAISRSGRRGPGLRPFAVNCAAIDPQNPPPGVGHCGGIRRAPGRFEGRTATMAHLARSLSILLQRPVIDRTGLSEPFDFDLE